MTDLLSPSPYAYLDVLSPSERQAEIYRRQHRENYDPEHDEFTGSVIDTARRARDLQAELTEAQEQCADLAEQLLLRSESQQHKDLQAVMAAHNETLISRDSYRTMCAELCEAANDTIERAQMWAGALPNPVDRSLDRLDEALTKARKLLEGGE